MSGRKHPTISKKNNINIFLTSKAKTTSMNSVIIEFNYASIRLKPYNGDNSTSAQLLKKIITILNSDDFPSDKRIIDRHENRKNAVNRKLVIISNRLQDKGQRCFGKIALIKNKAPMLWGGKDIIEEIKKVTNQQFIEVTNYVIDFNTTGDPVIMFEFNNEGPRLSDIEYYLRQVAKENSVAKSTETCIHLRVSYEQLDKELNNVFSVVVKVNAMNDRKANWLKTLRNLNEDSGYKDVRLELFFGRQKDKKGNYFRNIRGTDYARGIIEWLRKDKGNIEYLDDLKMTYQSNDSEDIIDLDFLKNKVISCLKIPTNNNIYTPLDFRNIVGQEFDYYLANGKPNS
jgi:hypothetical protein